MLKRSTMSADVEVASWSWYRNQQGTSTDDLHFDRCRTSSLSNLLEFLAPLSTQSTSSKEINWMNYRDEWNAKADCISRWAWLVQKDGRAFVYVVQVSSFFCRFMSVVCLCAIHAIDTWIDFRLATSTRTDDKLFSRKIATSWIIPSNDCRSRADFRDDLVVSLKGDWRTTQERRGWRMRSFCRTKLVDVDGNR